MIADLKPYPAMKDSDVPWLGEVPEHWEIERLKARAANIIEQTDERPSGGLYVALEHVESWTGRLRDAGSETSFESQVKRFRPDDVLFGKLRPYLAKVARPTREGVCVGEFFVLRSTANGVGADYLAHLLRSKSIIDTIDASTFGAKMPRADWSFVGNLALSFPPLREQLAIVRFLDHADRRIRRYIRAKQKLIKLLEEQKQAIIHRAVTRGLDSNARLKSSGVEWLGEVPAHWEVRPAKRFFREVDERSVTGEEELLSVSHLTGVTPRSQKKITMFMAESYVGHKKCRSGDLVINTMWAWMAALGVARQTGIVSPAYGVYRPHGKSPLLSDYADLLFRTRPYVSEYISRSTGVQASRLRLYPEQFLRIGVVCPPVGEQQAILEHIGRETAETNRAIAVANQEISLLREYCTRLIADVVTGKLDVRAAAASLPDEVDEPEATDDSEVLADGDEYTTDGDFDAAPEETEA